MKKVATLSATGLLVLAACGGDEDSSASSAPTSDSSAVKAVAQNDAAAQPARKGTTIRAAGSQFGSMLWGPRRRAVYVFQRDRRNRSNCYGACAVAWPPVFTKGKPVAGRGVRKSLLGTTRRRDGRRQVTYAGRPLYYYVHEGPGEVRCHNVNLNGGYWWVVGPNGKRRP